ncbi:hypothetical protein [Paenibacillus sp. F411]|uniref:hypothetical protein n=1 Tax=Paenibacillus sp. F411 TaxID=2820239 RepID=UPI001FBA6A7D|nr:hypothetical protein [Paenibacillus sp. F411]
MSQQLLIGILVCSLVICVILTIASVRIQRRYEALYGMNSKTLGPGGSLKDVRLKLKQWLQSLYLAAINIPGISNYVRRIRRKIKLLHPYDEVALRYETMKLILLVITASTLSGALLFMHNPGPVFIITSVLAAVIIHHLMIDLFLHRLELKLMHQTVELFSSVRHHYQQHGMVEEAIYEAATTSGHEISIHGHRIHQALISRDAEEELNHIYNTSPNRYIQAFAGISHLVLELGDHEDKSHSVFLKGLSSLTKELHLDILKRQRLDYLLKGLHAIALVPVFFTSPIEQWARASFPAMDVFYMSKLGILTKLSVYVVILAAYILLQKLYLNDEEEVKVGFRKKNWGASLLRNVIVYRIVIALLPSPGTPKYEQRTGLLKDSSRRIHLEVFYLRRLLLALGITFSMLVIFISLHLFAKHQLLHGQSVEAGWFGRGNPEVTLSVNTIRVSDSEIMAAMLGNDKVEADQLIDWISKASEGRWSKDQLRETAMRVQDKLNRYQHEYLKWWEVLLAAAAGYAGAYFPLGLLYFHRKVRRMEMKHEVYQLYTVISVLRDMKRISVEELLEWLSRFSVIFKIPIQKAVLHYEHGAELALHELRDEVWFADFRRLVDKLLLAEEKVSISEAFDDLDGEMSFMFEQRRQEYEVMIETKAAWGRMIGFAPMYALVFLYLVIPLIGMSFAQMNDYYEQIQNI